jgi:hypothetical protein
MKIYYAHCMAIYNTPQEKRDIITLANLGFDVINPNKRKHDIECKKRDRSMDYFVELVKSCDAVAFRANPDGSITSGVFMEVEIARSKGMPVIELPSSILRRQMTYKETKEYLQEIGER